MSNDPLKLTHCVHKALDTRELLGVRVADVHVVTRTWQGDRVGAGGYTDEALRMRPTPAIVDYSQNIRLQAGGAIQQGDLLLRQISKHEYPNRMDVDGSSSSELVEKFYDIGGKLYQVINVTEHLYWWNVQVRQLSAQRRNY